VYLAVGIIPGRFFCAAGQLTFRFMIELISVLFLELTTILLSEWLFGGLFKSIGWSGYRIYSIFTGEWGVPVSTLRKTHDGSIWPWVLLSCLFGGLLALASVL
jgi:hypothetical protein